MDPLPHSTADLPGVGGALRTEIEDFEVEEIPAYVPSGRGSHAYLWIEKRDLTTPEAITRLARAGGFDAHAVGWAGYKDRRAVTRQWISIEGLDAERARTLSADGVRVLDVGRHDNRLRTGHLAGNRFAIVLRGATDEAGARAIAQRLERDGLANFFGEQRFGREGDNAARAREFLLGGAPAPRDGRLRRLLASAWQSELFNRALQRRLVAGGHSRAMSGDLCVKHASGGMFYELDAAVLQARLDAQEVSITGPLYGGRMRWPEGDARVFEEALLAEELPDRAVLRAHGKLLPGGRRPYRLLPGPVEVARHPAGLRATFTLPAGAYATIVLRELCKTDVAQGPTIGQDTGGTDLDAGPTPEETPPP